jgi:hypothetical protein
MITERQLYEASLKINLFEFISNFIENKQDLKNKEILLEAWYSGWGDKIQSWGGKLGSFLGKTKKSFDNAKTNFRSSFDQQQESPPPQKETQLQIAKKAYELLKNANLLYDQDLKKALEKTMQGLSDSWAWRENNNLSFKQWLANEAISPKVFRPDLDQVDVKKFEVSIGDIVEMGPESEFKGKKVNRIGQVVELRSGEVVVKDLTKKGNPKIVIPISEFYDKEGLRGMRIIPKEETELKALGGKRLWVRLTPRQHKKFAGSYRASAAPEIIPIARDDRPTAALKQMFAMDRAKEPEQTLSIFDEKPKNKPKTNPLGRFLSSRRGIV